MPEVLIPFPTIRKHRLLSLIPGSHRRPLPNVRGSIDLAMLVDRSSLEVFAQGGEVAMTMLFYPPEGPLTVRPSPGPATLWSNADINSTWGLASAVKPDRRKSRYRKLIFCERNNG